MEDTMNKVDYLAKKLRKKIVWNPMLSPFYISWDERVDTTSNRDFFIAIRESQMIADMQYYEWQELDIKLSK